MTVTLERPEARTPYPARRWWGYGVWLFVGAVIATSELWAAFGNPWWPTISATVAFLIIPNVLAYWFAKDVPFPTLFRTLADLDRRWHPLVLIIVAGLSVLVVHLVAYPWP